MKLNINKDTLTTGRMTKEQEDIERVGQTGIPKKRSAQLGWRTNRNKRPDQGHYRNGSKKMVGLRQSERCWFCKVETKYESPPIGIFLKTHVRTTVHTKAPQCMWSNPPAHLQKFQCPSSRKLMDT